MLIDECVNTFSEEGKKINWVHLKCQNVSDYYFNNKKEYWDIFSDFPSCLPPWDNFCITFNHPKSINNDGDIMNTNISAEYAIFVDSQKINKVMFRDSNEVVKINIDLSLFIKLGGELLSVGNAQYFLNNDGTPIKIVAGVNSNGSPKYFIPGTGDGTFHTPEESHQWVVDFSKIALLAINFCNCRNVSVIPNNLPTNLIKRRRKENRLPITKFYTLKIGDEPRHEHSNGNGGSTKSFHICRGHFKHYGELNPLFGKYIGTYWCPMHTKGQQAVGEIKKDYVVYPTTPPTKEK